jgi:DNA polymerase-1
MPAAPASGKKLFLIDAMGFLYRALHAPMQRLESPAGLPTKVPYVFANMLRRVLKDWQPDYLGVVFDAPGRTFRDDLFTHYKAQRAPMPDDLKIQIPFVRRMCEAMRLPILEQPGYEADDVIGALARQGAAQGLDVYIVTSDKDMLQLVGGPIKVIRPAAGSSRGDILVDAPQVEEILGVPPEKVVDVMALMGDSIDNIPGARGIGEKGARELILQYGSAEAALEHAAEVKNKRYREALQNSREAVVMSKQLATIAADAPVSLALDALRPDAPDPEALRALYAELGFTSLLRELAPAGAAAAAGDYTKLESPAALREYLRALPPGQEVALWLALTRSDEDISDLDLRIAAIEISPRAGEARVAWLDEKGEVLAALREWLADPSRPKIVHDPKLVELLLGDPHNAGHPDADRREPGATAHHTTPDTPHPISGVRHATMLYSYLLRPTTSNHSLDEVVLRHLSVTLAGAPGERADYAGRLAPILREEIESRGLAGVYETIDLPLAPVLARMERAGVRVDPAALERMSAAMEQEIAAMQARIHELAGAEFNLDSPKQLAEILFDKLQLPMPRKYGRGKVRSTAADVLEALAESGHELPRKIIEYREVAKLKSTYVDALPRLIHPRTGRLHTSLTQTGTATGRLASSNPNLQNIPVRTELGREIRAAFAASPGCVLLSADYSQIELRILAHYSEDAVLVEAFQKGEDIHARTAQEVFGVGPLMQTAEHRRAAKVINFGIIYGLSPFGLAQQLGIEQKEAAQFIAAYFARYRGVKQWHDRLLEEVRRTQQTRTLFGRIRPIPEINSKMVAQRNFAERTALNTPLQGTAADLIKLAMIHIDAKLETRNSKLGPANDDFRRTDLSIAGSEAPQSHNQKINQSTIAHFAPRMILQVHDELLFEVPEDQVASLRSLVKPAMENVHALRVPLVVDIKVGPDWRDMK